MMQPWFEEAKLGIFIHYGIYSVNGVPESWYFRYDALRKYKPYMKQLNGFTASKYDPEAWAKLFHEAGARYAVLTTKHHDGVALFDTKQCSMSVVKKTPAGRDLVAPYCDALRKEGLRVGLYFTQCDWANPEYSCKDWRPVQYAYDKFFNKGRDFEHFKAFHRAQLKELLTNYGQVDLLWFDGDWERSQEDWDMKGLRAYLDNLSPKTVINSRIGSYGDYATPEQQIPCAKPEGPWEYCMTINDSWGWQPQDNHYKTAGQIIRIFTEVITMGGNLLLDVGPKEDGTIDPRAQEALRGLGKFTKSNEKAIWGTDGFSNGMFLGGSTISKDKKTLYFFQFEPLHGPTMIERLGQKIKKISLVASGEKLCYKQQGDTVWVDVPKDAFDENIAVLAVELESAYEGEEESK